ncbi:MAG: hypothetical protein Kow0027_16980 [Saprospiraceae bacterium]
MRRVLTFLFLFLVPALSFSQKNILNKLIRQNADRLGEVAAKPEKYEVQVIYTQIDRDQNNKPTFTTSTWQLDENRYFYPASTVKMPVAFMALEKLNKLSIIGLDKHSTMLTGEGHPPQSPVEKDSTAATGLPSVAHYVKKIFLVSDNDANNRLYEFLGQGALNEALRQKGYDHSRIIHRLGISGFDAEANCYTNPVSFFNGKRQLYFQGEVYSRFEPSFSVNGERKGKGYFQDGKFVEQPFDFSKKNYVSLRNLHDMLQAVIFPDDVPSARRFDLTEEDYRFLYQVMSERPRESRFPNYADKPDHYVKFFIYGDRSDADRMPDHVRIFNKVGWAYGYLTDVAYVVDFENGVEFFLAATINVNEDGIYNDDNYEYTTVGLPFLAELGRVVYEYELKRKRRHKPDLSRFIVEKYD